MAKTLTKEDTRYVLRIDDALVAAADFVVKDTSISFTHTFTDPKLRGKGYAREVVDFAVDDVEKNTDLRVIPMCWYVGKWFDERPERAGLLTR
jgi:predicted GNAT family acetyltransferase